MSDDLTTREQLVAALTPLLPEAWRVVPYSRSLDTLDRVTVMVHASRIEHAPQAPLSQHVTTLAVSVFDPQSDPERAQGALDDEVGALLFALDELPWVSWSSAEASQLPDGGPLGWDVTLETITKKD